MCASAETGDEVAATRGADRRILLAQRRPAACAGRRLRSLVRHARLHGHRLPGRLGGEPVCRVRPRRGVPPHRLRQARPGRVPAAMAAGPRASVPGLVRRRPRPVALQPRPQAAGDRREHRARLPGGGGAEGTGCVAGGGPPGLDPHAVQPGAALLRRRLGTDRRHRRGTRHLGADPVVGAAEHGLRRAARPVRVPEADHPARAAGGAAVRCGGGGGGGRQRTRASSPQSRSWPR